MPYLATTARLLIITAGLIIASCDAPEPAVQQGKPQRPTAKPEPVLEPVPELTRPLNLSIDELSHDFVDTQANHDEPDRSLIKIKEKEPNRIELGGKLLTDENVEDYVNSLDGAKVDIIIRTR